ncbi:protein kinase domain-containing protein [Lignipirellula cremea]|nr:AarF/UbiB family protein [Lignipirellula cremea]
MLQNPKIAFRDADLKECSVEKNNLGQPKPRSGNFATVYKGFKGVGQEFAIRVFNRAANERRERYQALNDYLKDRRLGCLVDFTYDEKGIRAPDGKMYPLVTMDWVPGVTLFEWSRERAHEGYQEAFAIAAEVWLSLVRELASHGIVHGDLQHGNVLISSEGQFKLVDYDCMAVPELMGRRNLEMGMAPYQHPARNAETQLFAGLDNFSALLIYVALRALAAQPSLWRTYVDQPEYDKMLFRTEDFDNPQASPLYRDLLNSPEKQVRDLGHYLFQLASYDISQVPPVDEVLLWCNSIEDLLHAKEWDKAVQLHQRMGPGEQIPQHLQPLVAEAYRRVACREALEKALASGVDAEIQRCYVPALLNDYPAATPLVERARMAAQLRQVLTTLEAARRMQNWQVFVQTYRAHQENLSDLPAAQPFKNEMTRLMRAHQVRKLLGDKTSSDRAVIEAWKMLESLGGHPVAEPLRPHVDKRIARQRVQELIREAPETPTLAYDKELASKLKSGAVGDSPQQKAVRQKCQEAVTRLKSLEEINRRAKECTLESEGFLVETARKLPRNYHASITHRVKQAEQRLKVYQLLEEAFRDPSSDLEIMEQYRALERLHAAGMVTEEWSWRVHLAAARVPLIRALQQIARNLPLDQLDHRLLSVWREDILDSCTDAAPWKAAYKTAVERQRLLPQLAEAIENGDESSLRTLTAAPCLEHYPLPPELAEGIAEARRRAQREREQRRHGLLQAMIDNERAQFVALFEVNTVREIAESHSYHQPVISRWTEAEMVRPERNGLGVIENGVELLDPLHVRLRWQWPREAISKRCILAITQEKVGPHAIADDLRQPLYKTTLDYSQWLSDESRHEVEVHADWNEAQIFVWTVIDLGYELFHSPPVELGRLSLIRKKRWGIF